MEMMKDFPKLSTLVILLSTSQSILGVEMTYILSILLTIQALFKRLSIALLILRCLLKEEKWE